MKTKTGQFAKGNPGRPKGTKNIRTLQWAELGNEITNANADRFNELLSRLWDSSDINDQVRAAELFLKMAEFFKPKLQRITIPLEPAPFPVPIITMSGCNACTCDDCKRLGYNDHPHSANVKQLNADTVVIREVVRRTP
jgi:hypothetical protein